MNLLVGVLLFLAALALASGALRIFDAWADRRERARLLALQPHAPSRFTAEMVADLPEPAQRYFRFTIAQDTPLYPVAEIEMGGQFSLGTKETPKYQPMQARQTLAAPEGVVWAMRTRGGLPISGSDSGRWTRFRILWLVSVARLGGTPNHARSAYGRFVAEAVFRTPAALLPGPGVRWGPVDETTARVTVERGELLQAVDVTVDYQGRPAKVTFERWSDANPDKVHRLQPFGGYLSELREIAGYRLPFRVEAGNMFGTEDYFPFFIADVKAIRFPAQGGAA